MYAVADTEFTAEGNADILVNRYMPLWGYPISILSGNGLRFFSKLSVAILNRLSRRALFTRTATEV